MKEEMGCAFMNLHRWDNTSQDRNFRNKTNENWQTIESGFFNQSERLEEVTTEQNNRIENLVINAPGGKDPMVLDALTNNEGASYSSLRTRLDIERKEQLEKIKRLNKHLEDISVNVDDFLLNTEMYDDEAIKRAIDYAVLNKKRHVRLAMRTYKITKTLEIDVSYVCLISSGAVIDATEIIEGKAIFVKGTVYPPYTQSVDALINIELIGRGRTNNTIGIYFSSENASSPSHISLRNINIHGFGENVYFGNKSYIITFYACDIWDSNYCVVSQGTTDAGERYTFIGSSLYNSNNLVKQNNQNSSIKMIACSLDYQSFKSVEIENGRVSLIGCHIEAGSDNDYWFSVKNNGSLLQLTNCEIFVASERNNFELGYCNESVKLGGIDIRDCFISMARYKKQLLIAGNGRVSAKNIKMFELDKKPGISKSLNVMRDGGFGSIDALLDWDITSETKPTIVNEGKITPVCLKFQADNGKNCSIKKEFLVSPGELFSFSFWIKTQNLESSGKQFFIEISYLDEKNNILYKGGTIFSKDSDWDLYIVQNAKIAPPGSRKAVVGFNTGAWLNTCSVWIDEVVVNVY
ncbi:hypothetical protein [Bacillus cereus]|uniref:hypothetical protein n=1 Tax=Bacillus cereus TaxID=1396 RepID=UPI00019FE30B|nr:hypothetical protein [Bacillus cereus]EEK53341.1 hypothetical protein bcere0004_53370 [Bacillus cereus BGSC 6E1]